jgi:hypothetical protein
MFSLHTLYTRLHRMRLYIKSVASCGKPGHTLYAKRQHQGYDDKERQPPACPTSCLRLSGAFDALQLHRRAATKLGAATTAD